QMEPQESVVPILALDDSDHLKHFLGTGVFVGTRPFLVTAEHVVRDWSGQFAVAILPDIDRVAKATLIKKDKQVDLAVLEVPGYPAEKALQLASDDEIKLNYQIATFEYSTTRIIGEDIYLSPATRIGNVTRVFNLTDLYGKAGESALELSFPALGGASGAPVISNQNFRLWGIIIANVS